jgi:hypothetical protein
MSINQYISGSSGANFTFAGSTLHGDVIPSIDWEPELVQEKFFGVQGESHLIGAPAGRDLSCEYWLTGYVSAVALGADLVTIDSWIGRLLGAIVMSGNITGQYNNCTFLGYPRGARFFDGAGNLGWCVAGHLLWRQRKP